MNQFNGRERRRFFRLRYPPEDRPTISIQGTVYMVTEISEQGLRFQSKDAFDFMMRQEVIGAVHLHLGESCTVTGHIHRIELEEIVLELYQSIPGRVVVSEQRYLINRHRRD